MSTVVWADRVRAKRQTAADFITGARGSGTFYIKPGHQAGSCSASLVTIGILPTMPKTERELRDDIVRIGQLVHQKGWVAANDGNISIRLGPDRVLCTPTGVSKGMMQPDDLIICDMQGNKVEGVRERTSEIMMHLTIYSLRPDSIGVVHTHPVSYTHLTLPTSDLV